MTEGSLTDGMATSAVHPWEMGLRRFVGLFVVSPHFSIDGRRDEDYSVLWDFAQDPASLGSPVWTSDDGAYSVCECLEYEPVGTFILLEACGAPCGFYTDGQCWVDEDHRGKGLSRSMILASARYRGGPPIRDSEHGIGYSPAGLAAHVSAWRHAIEQAVADGLPVPPTVLRDLSRLRRGTLSGRRPGASGQSPSPTAA